MKSLKITEENRNGGITLIALVITIIVILILAGVSISMLTGNNSILNQATNAVTNTDMAQVKEEIQLAILEKQVDGNGTYTKQDVYNIALSLDDVSSVNEEEGTATTIKGNIIDLSEILSGAHIETLAEVITADNYGDVVEYSANGIDDWKIFYSDGTNVFLITSSYLDHDQAEFNVPNSVGITTRWGYDNYWERSSTVFSNYTEISSQAKKFLFNWNKVENKNEQAVASLVDTDAWSYFVDEEYADYAIGSPTLEMWVSSWNKKYPEENISYSSNNIGYIINGTVGYVDLSSLDEYMEDDLFFPSKSEDDYDYTCGYYLASPGFSYSVSEASEYYSGYICFCNATGEVGSLTTWTAGGYQEALRPVVCLKSDITGEKNEDEIWQLSI